MAILDRDLAVAQVREAATIGGPALRAVVDEAAGVCERCGRTGPDNEEILAILPLHHVVEMLDGVEVLLRHSCVVAAAPLLRSAFEGSMAVRYILEDKDQITTRAKAYMVANMRERLRYHEERDPETTAGAKFRHDMHIGPDSKFPMPDVAATRANGDWIRERLAQKSLRDIDAAYDESGTSKRGSWRTPNWYSLFDGPQHLRDLAVHLGDVRDYLILYSHFSRTVHGMDMYRQLLSGGRVVGIREPFMIGPAYSFACGLGQEAARPVLEHFRPGEVAAFIERVGTTVLPAIDKLERMRFVEAES